MIEDFLKMAGEHDIDLFFHCSERCQVDTVPGGYALSQGNRTLVLRLPQAQGASSRSYRGSIAPILGWVSRRFDTKQPAPTIAWRARITGEIVLRSEIIC